MSGGQPTAVRGADRVQGTVRARDLGRALDGWGRFTGADGRDRAPGEWISADGELVRGGLDRTVLDLLTVDADRFAVTRTAEHVARTPHTRHIVVAQLAGTSVLTPSDGHPPVRLGPGDVSYGDPTVPYRWAFEGPATLLLLRTPFAAFAAAPGSLRAILGRPFASSSGYARLALRFAVDALREPGLVDGPSGPRVLGDVAGLFATMLVDRAAAVEDADPGSPAYRRAVAHIEAHLAAPLTVAGIAAAADMSPRHLQSLFRRRGTTVSGWIRARRLEGARAALADPDQADADITRIAVGHGFADHSHFTRTFRAAFGETPSRWRERAASSVDDAARS